MGIFFAARYRLHDKVRKIFGSSSKNFVIQGINPMRKRLWAFGSLGVFSLAVIMLPTPVRAQQERIEILRQLKADVSRPVREMPPVPTEGGHLREIPVRPLPGHPETGQFDSALQTSITSSVSVAATAGSSFDGVGVGFVGPNGSATVNVAPPDTNGAAGSTQFVQWVNLFFAVFNKTTGNVLLGPTAGKTLWSGMTDASGKPHPCSTNNDGDVIAQYDKLANRWVMAQLSYTGGPPYYLCLAVSTTSDATGSFVRYALDPNEGSGIELFPDYPKIGIWPDSRNNAYLVTFNMFDCLSLGCFFEGAQTWALDRQAMLSGANSTAVGFQLSSAYGGLLPSDLDGQTVPPSGSPGYFVNFGSNSLNLWKFSVDWSSVLQCASDNLLPSACLAGPTAIPVASFSPGCAQSCVPQAGTSQKLDALGDRMMYRLAYRNFGAFDSLAVNHSVNIGSGGRHKNSSSIGVRWYEIRNPGGSPTVHQQATFAPDSNFRWMGSIAMDKVGNMAMGYSVSSSSINPAIRFTGRLVTDPLNTMETETTVWNGTGSQLQNLSRWGDYSSISVDPVDDCTFWYTSEYLKSSGTFNWSTRIASFKFSTCP